MSSYYELLGVPPNASEMEIRSAYGRDVLRLQEMASDKVAQFRAALDAAFATLVDPAKRSAYDAELARAVVASAAEDSDVSDKAFRYARNGGLWFAAGGLVTAATYAFSSGAYFLAWGPLIFGGFQLVRGMLRYLGAPGGVRRSSQLALLGGLVAVGILSASFVAVSEARAAQEVAELATWNSMIDATELEVAQASAIVNGVADHAGPWDAKDSADMARASALYGHVADTVAAASAPARLEWYRVAMAKNFRDAAAITHEYSVLSASSSAAAFDALDSRWEARLKEGAALADRFQAEEGKAP
jgi:hypothetical protein